MAGQGLPPLRGLYECWDGPLRLFPSKDEAKKYLPRSRRCMVSTNVEMTRYAYLSGGRISNLALLVIWRCW